jgi:cytochrome b involved in lipid metabolism
MKKLLLITAIAATFILTACSTKAVPATQTPTTTQTTTVSAPTTTQTTTTNWYTAADVAKHNTASDCRSIIGNKVYNLSSYFGNHPGGDKTLQIICGKDGTATFNRQHAGSNNAEAMLQPLFIGDLK